jgi:hypothetical protein
MNAVFHHAIYGIQSFFKGETNENKYAHITDHDRQDQKLTVRFYNKLRFSRYHMEPGSYFCQAFS